MNLGKYIHILLKKNSVVYVKGLGVFRRIYTPAAFDPKKNVYLPPVTFIEFDATATDGYDLVTYVQQIDQSDRAQAEHKLEQAVSHIKEDIIARGQVMLDSLGQLVGYGNSYIFKPLDLSGFAFAPIEGPSAPALVQSEPQESAAPTADPPSPEGSAVGQLDEPVTPVPEDPAAEAEDEQYGAPSNSRSYVYGLVAALAVLVLAGLYYYSQHYQEPSPRGSIAAVATQDSLPVLDTTDMAAYRDTTEQLDTIPQGMGNAPVDSNAVEQYKYTIVIGTHPTLAKAYEEAEAFNKDGHKSVRVVTPNLAKNLKRVIWDTYATKEERDSALRYVQKHIKTDAWPAVLP